MSKFCVYCGSWISDTALYCLNCGKPINRPPSGKTPPVYPNNYPAQGKVPVKKSNAGTILLSVIVSGTLLAGPVYYTYTQLKSIVPSSYTASKSPTSNGQKIQQNQIKNAGNLYTFLEIPDNYSCRMVITMNGENIINGDVWYKDGKSKLNFDLGIMKDLGSSLNDIGIDFSKMVSFSNAQTGEFYTCIPSLKVAVKSAMGTDMYYDQSSVTSMVDSGVPFKGTRAVTVDGIQCTVYVFEDAGITGEIYVRNSLETIIRCVITDKTIGTVDVYFKNMEIGMVTSGDVLMTNEYNNYKVFNNDEEFANWLLNYMMQKMPKY